MTVGFTGSPLERLDSERDDLDALARRQADAAARLLLLDGLDPVAADSALAWGTLGDAPEGSELALLGELDGRSRFVALTEGAAGRMHPALLQTLITLPEGEAALYAGARALVDWHARHRYCAKCGGTTDNHRAGWARRCTACRTEHFPRTDPVVIMLAEHDDRVLVGRQAAWPQGRFSALAGFVEVGESMEEAVARELHEEAGVRATAVRYVASQPWPFGGSQLMLACIARVESDALTLDAKELEEAHWLSRQEVADALAEAPGARFLVPPPYAIAHTLFTRWLEGA